MADGSAGSYLTKFIAAVFGVGLALGALYFLTALAWGGDQGAVAIIFFGLLGALALVALIDAVTRWFALSALYTLIVVPLAVLAFDGFEDIRVIAAGALAPLAFVFFLQWWRDRRRTPAAG